MLPKQFSDFLKIRIFISKAIECVNGFDNALRDTEKILYLNLRRALSVDMM